MVMILALATLSATFNSNAIYHKALYFILSPDHSRPSFDHCLRSEKLDCQGCQDDYQKIRRSRAATLSEDPKKIKFRLLPLEITDLSRDNKSTARNRCSHLQRKVFTFHSLLYRLRICVGIRYKR